MAVSTRPESGPVSPVQGFQPPVPAATRELPRDVRAELRPAPWRG